MKRDEIRTRTRTHTRTQPLGQGQFKLQVLQPIIYTSICGCKKTNQDLRKCKDNL